VTSDFASLLHSSERGIIVGEETGGGYYGNTSGIDKMLTLPNSKLRANINFIKYINNRKPGKNLKRRGVIPHYEIQPSQEDIAKGIDREFIFALELIESGKKN